jgi:para-nitrobenzyl esterase
MKMRKAEIMLMIIASCTALLLFSAPADPVVSVTGGQIKGRAPQDGATFKGIPYAAPPVGNLRWREPMPVKPWPGVRDAGEYCATCSQIDAGWNKTAAGLGQEDCLFLNVWAPEWPPKSKKPVMFWIHGGGNMGGSAGGAGGIEPLFDGERLSRHGVVVVTINYRLGVFGFLAHPALTAESPHHISGNYGILDQIAALQWVKQNIATFGGDPAKVTVFGQSAGGHDVGLLLVSPLSKGLFARAMEESGTVIGGLRASPTLAAEEKMGSDIVARLNPPAGSGTLAYLRKLTAAEVLKASPAYSSGEIGPNADGYVVPEVAAQMFAAGRQHKVPLLIGSNARESSLAGGAEALEKGIKELYGDMAPQAAKLYAQPSNYPPYGDAGAQFATDRNRCSSVMIADFHAAAGNIVYQYEFSHPFPDSNRGAPHSGELRYVFGNFPPGAVADSERRISNEMQTYWTNFAKTGDPNGGGLPVWPKFDTKARRYIEFTDNGPVVKENLRGDFCRLFTDFMKQRMAKP